VVSPSPSDRSPSQSSFMTLMEEKERNYSFVQPLPLVLAAFAVVRTHQTALGPCGGLWPFSLYVIHKNGLCPRSGYINRLMIMKIQKSLEREMFCKVRSTIWLLSVIAVCQIDDSESRCQILLKGYHSMLINFVL
jgi:hypothetical protein